jgi:phosphoribosylformylglycinamidine (FGAM) synthase-like enzyme
VRALGDRRDATIGEVTDTASGADLRRRRAGRGAAGAALVDDCPLYDLEPQRRAEPLYAAPPRTIASEDPAQALLALLASPNIADRRPLFEQYDAIVQSRTCAGPAQADAAVLALPPRGDLTPGIAIAIDGNGRRVAADPYRGTIEVVLECAANLACVGASRSG